MKEFFASIWLGIGSLFGFTDETPVQEPVEFTQMEVKGTELPVFESEAYQETLKEEVELVLEEVVESPQKAPVDAEEDTGMVSDGQFDYETPEDAEWWAPVQGHATISEHVSVGLEGQVSTLWGDGSQGQGVHNLDHPRDVQVDANGNVYFVDGSQYSAKLRMFNGTENVEVVDLVDNKISRREGYFASTGLALMHGNVYISNTEDLYEVVDGRITQVTPKVRAYMENQRLQNLYRIEKHDNYLYLMFFGKSRQFHIARYDIAADGPVEEVIPTKPMPSPYNFYVDDNGILIATTTGYVIYEQFFPRQTLTAWKDGDHKTEVADVWVGQDEALYFMKWEDQNNHTLYRNPKGIDVEGVTPVIGERRGFVDGFNDEVEMDYPTDFVWDGSGYIFADMGNNALRKYWTTMAPSNAQ